MRALIHVRSCQGMCFGGQPGLPPGRNGVQRKADVEAGILTLAVRDGTEITENPDTPCPLSSCQPIVCATPNSAIRKRVEKTVRKPVLFNSLRKCSHRNSSVFALPHWRKLSPAPTCFRSRLSWAGPSLEVTSA